VKAVQTQEIGSWTDHDLDAFRELGFEPVAQIDDQAQSIAVLSFHDPETFAFLYAGTPYVELHTVFARGFAVVTSDTPLRVDEFGEHEGRKERPGWIANHRFLPLPELLAAHRALVTEVSGQRGPPRDARDVRGALRRLHDLEGKRSLADYRGLFLLAAVFVGTIALAVGALFYFD